MEWLIFLVHFIVSIIEVTQGQKVPNLTGCQKECGGVDIPYPFGIGPNCSLHKGFALTCNMTDDNLVPFHGNVQVLNITVATAQARLYNYIAWQCYDNSNGFNRISTSYLNLNHTVYRLSSLDNKFTVIGCETLAFNEMQDGKFSYLTGCVSTCYNRESLTNGSCSGNGCCQTSVPSGISYYDITFDQNYSSQVWNYSLCSYAVVMAADSFKFSTSYISTYDFWYAHNGTVPVVLDWSIGTTSCEVAKADMSSYACVSNNSVCLNSTNGQGYICNCSTGYQGNPYLSEGCQDIDECKDNISMCSSPRKCQNTVGSYKCVCPPGTKDNGTKYGMCYTTNGQNLSRITKMAIGIGGGLLLLLFFSFATYIVYQRRRLASIRENYFQQYGGRLLLEEMKRNHGNSFTIFTAEELIEATNNFDETKILGQGGNGTVYKGTLKNNADVAIKKSKTIDARNKKEFGKEMLILSRINHINIVRILGCCLQVEIPILVYEFIPKGTLFDLLHSKSASRVSFSTRLRIAQEAAEALAFLHSWASPPIVHCDVKSANILLAENYVAKVSDFGASALAPADEDQFVTMVQGTRGYLDPQCMQTGQLTVKSDVYSFGVVLLELLSRKKAFYLEGAEERGLSSAFLSAMRENKIEEILDEQILDDENMNLIMGVAELARECLNMEGEKRPEMREVAERLDKLRKSMKHPWVQDNGNEIESLLGEHSNNHEVEMTSYRTLEKKAMLVMETGR